MKILFCYLGGEPTVHLDKLTELVRIATEKVKSVFPDRFFLGISTNGYYGRDIELIKKVDELRFEIVELSCSKDHYNQGNSSWMRNIWENSKRRDNFWVSYIGGEENIKPFYPFFDNVNEEKKVGYAIRNNIYHKDMVTKSEFTDEEILAVIGIYITPKGIYTCCIGEGHKETCFIGNVNEVEECLNKSRNAYTRIKMNGRLDTISPACLYLKKCFNINASCLNNSDIEIIIKDDNSHEVKINGRSDK